MNKQEEDTYITSENVSNNHNSNSTLREAHKIEGTPFHAVRVQEKWFLAFGNNRVTENVKSKEEVEDMLKTNMWDIITSVVIIVQEKAREWDRIKQDTKEESL